MANDENHAFNYSLELHTADGRNFGQHPVPAAALEPARAQVIFDAQRRGVLPADSSSVVVVERPVFDAQAEDEISGIVMSTGSHDDQVQRKYGRGLFQTRAEALTADLLRNKQVDAEQDVLFRVLARRAAAEPNNTTIRARRKGRSLPLQHGTLEPYLAAGDPVGAHNNEDYPVFALKDVLDQAQELCGGDRGDEEAGAWLTGTLYQQHGPKPEIFAVIDGVIEAREANHQRFSLDLTTASFAHVQAQLDRRRKRFGQDGLLLVGMYHTHPFLPSILDGKEACPQCVLRSECDLSSSFFSKKDAEFHTAVFGRAPYAVQLVLGLDPREAFDLNMFCWDGGSFRQRGYWRLAHLPHHAAVTVT